MYGIRKGVAVDWNTGEIRNDLQPHALKTFEAGVNFTMIGVLPSWGFDVSLYNIDRQKGIDKKMKDLKEGMKKISENIVSKLESDKVLSLYNETDSQAAMENRVKMTIKEELKSQRKNTDDETLKKASENIYQALKQFNLFGTALSPVEKQEAIYRLADFYTTSRKNQAEQGLVDKGREWTKLSGGMQFLAVVYPVVSAVARFTKYHSTYAQDTEQSKAESRARETL
jgi:hypothetical protein